MGRFSVVLCLLCLTCVCIQAQSRGKLNRSDAKSINSLDPGAQAILALRKLDQDVIVYSSLGEFESNQKLARVSRQTLEGDLQSVTGEIERLLPQIEPGKLRSHVLNALASYRDGLFWWRQIDPSRVVHVSSLVGNDQPLTQSDNAFRTTVPYTTAIHWRQAHKYLSLAENSIQR